MFALVSRPAFGSSLLSLSLVLAALAWATPVQSAEEPLKVSVDRLVTDEFIQEVREWATAPVIISALKGRVATAGKLSESDIKALDDQWRAERESEDQPLITSVLSGPVSSYLTRIQARSVGLYSEIFVMDQNGLNVGQSAITSDYWQGDEGKFQKTFGVGNDAVFVDEAEFNGDTYSWRAQLNMTISDGGEKLGAITVEINLTEVERRLLASL